MTNTHDEQQEQRRWYAGEKPTEQELVARWYARLPLRACGEEHDLRIPE